MMNKSLFRDRNTRFQSRQNRFLESDSKKKTSESLEMRAAVRESLVGRSSGTSYFDH